MTFMRIVGAIVVGEYIYSWVVAAQSIILSRYLRSKYRDQLMQKHLEQMPVGRAN